MASIQSDPSPSPGWSTSRLGEMIRAIRTSHGLSLLEVARRSDLSPSFLSQVETGQSDISVGRMMRVAQALGVDPALFVAVESHGRRDRVVRSEDLVPLPDMSAGVQVLPLAPSQGGTRTHALCVFEPGAVVEPRPRPQGGDAFIFVIEGSALFAFHTSDEVELRPGDSVSYRTEEFKRSVAGDEGCRLIWVLAPRHARSESAPRSRSSAG